MLKDIFKYKIAFKVPVVMLFFSIIGVYYNFIHIDLWFNEKLEAGYQLEISFKYLANLITEQFYKIINTIKGEF